jgi:uncharacterized protein YqjF (DUF2071 family)
MLAEVSRSVVQSSVDDISASPPERIGSRTMRQRWSDLAFLHWAVPLDAVQRLLPDGLRVDVFDGAAWVGIVPFRLDITLPRLPFMPWLSRFAEVNVRTYVVGPDGRRGIWFLSLDAAHLAAVLVARRTYRIPYVWSRSNVHREGRSIRYETERRWPRQHDAALTAEVKPESFVSPDAFSPLERFLTCRWRLYSPAPLELPARRIGLCATQVEHPPWPLWRAICPSLHETLLQAAGIERPSEPALAHFSTGVDVWFGARVRVPLAGGHDSITT